MPYGGEWVLVGSAVFKTDVGGEEPPGCVRFARASATSERPGRLPHQGQPPRRVRPPYSYAMASATDTRAAREAGSRLASTAISTTKTNHAAMPSHE